MPMTIFTLTSARSGTLYLKGLFEKNVKDCVCRHEPFFDIGNPTLFGRAIYDAQRGNLDRIRQLLAKKRNYIRGLNAPVYLETSHAFLKSAYVAALEFFPDMRLIHVIRDPLKIAKSEAYREEWRRRMRAPFHYYKGDDGNRYFVWALTGNEPIYRRFNFERITLFQRYLIQWIEIENRAIHFLEQNRLHDRCMTLHSPHDLNDPEKIKELFSRLGVQRRSAHLVMNGRKNRSWGHVTRITDEDIAQADEVIARLPDEYLKIFRNPPYNRFDWSRR
ncbi:MAG: hypothetical protein ACK4UN_16280, partial [Limisphaerales bacterium]